MIRFTALYARVRFQPAAHEHQRSSRGFDKASDALAQPSAVLKLLLLGWRHRHACAGHPRHSSLSDEPRSKVTLLRHRSSTHARDLRQPARGELGKPKPRNPDQNPALPDSGQGPQKSAVALEADGADSTETEACWARKGRCASDRGPEEAWCRMATPPTDDGGDAPQAAKKRSCRKRSQQRKPHPRAQTSTANAPERIQGASVA